MARDFEKIRDIDDLSDDERKGLGREHLAANNSVDIDDIVVTVKDGVVMLDGRVGTDGERLVAEPTLTDVIGIQEFENNLFVDPIRRAVSPEAIDEHLVEADRHE